MAVASSADSYSFRGGYNIQDTNLAMSRNRLFQFTMEDMLGLSRQQVAKFVDRTLFRMPPGSHAWNPFDELVRNPELSDMQHMVQVGDLWGAAALLTRRFREQFLGRFFEGTAGYIGSLLPERWPEAEGGLVASADRLCENRFELLGYRDLSFGDPVDWHLDPLTRRRVPLAHWSVIDPFDSAAVGDCTLIWALNRHQWLITLGQAYQLTENEQYARQFDETVRDWIRTNPAGVGINWVDSAEVSFRLIAWCWALSLFRQSSILTPELFVLMLDTIRAHAAHIERYLSYDAPNTRLTVEALGLFYVGTLFQELRSAARWRVLGFRILVEQLRKQTFPDGIYFEQSTCYQRYTIDIYIHFLILAGIHGLRVPWFVAERLQTMLDALLALRQPDGTLPHIGDTDGGRLLPLSTRGSDDCRDVFAVAAVMFRRADYAWAADSQTSEMLWHFGTPGLKEFEALTTAAPTGKPSQTFPYGGYVAMRSGWERHAHHLIFDVGPLAAEISSGHGHADLLGIQCSAFGETILADPGLSGYAHPDWRTFFRSTRAHSTVMVDRVEQADPAGLFSWKRMPRARLRQWQTYDTYELADGDHEAYGRLPDPVRHRRRVLFVKQRYWILIEDLSGKMEHRIDLCFQFAPLAVELNGLQATAWSAAGPGLYIVPFAGKPLHAEMQQGAEMPIQGWYAPAYGQRVQAPRVRYSVSAPLPFRIVTLLYPMSDRSAALPDVVADCSDGGLPVRVTLRDRIETIVIGDDRIAIEEV
jgi:Heparinase II/III-like protein/Heparinase II/III N-terminus